MDVELSDWAQTRIEELVASGRASCAREAIDFALAALAETDSQRDDAWWARLAELDDAADADVQQGRVREANAAFFKGLRARAVVSRGESA